MKVYYKDVVLSDYENFICNNPAQEGVLPMQQYANAKGFDYGMFKNFMEKLSKWEYAPSNEIDVNNVSVNELTHDLSGQSLVGKTHAPKTRGNMNTLYFSLTDEEVSQFAPIIAYYSALAKFAYGYADTINYTEVFDIYWKYAPKIIPEDPYNETRYLYFPYLIELSQWENKSHEIRFVDVPERYKEEWYYAGIGSAHQKEIANGDYIERIGDSQSYVFWKLIPVSAETPYEDQLPKAQYTYDSIHNHMPTDLQWSSAIQKNVAGDMWENSNVQPRQWV